MAKSKYDESTFPLLAEGFAREGLNDEQISKKLGISHQTYYDYQKKYPEFFEAIKRGKAPIDTEVENALLKRALGFDVIETSKTLKIEADGTETLKELKTIIKHFAPDVGAIVFWLVNRKPDYWKDKKDVNTKHEFPNKDVMIEFTTTDTDE
jgi:transposase